MQTGLHICAELFTFAAGAVVQSVCVLCGH